VNCHDCNCKEGELHHLNCDMERCPFCGSQLLICSCCYEKLNIDVSKGTWAYKHGLDEEQEEKWLEILEQKGRIPWICIPNLCVACGKNWPEFFNVPNKEWEKYVIPELQEHILCRLCYKRMKQLFPNGWRKAKEARR